VFEEFDPIREESTHTSTVETPSEVKQPWDDFFEEVDGDAKKPS
jgi:hypothetical protein